MYRLLIQASVFFFLVVISFNYIINPFEQRPIPTFSTMQHAIKEKDPLYEEIIAKRSDYKIPAQNAIIDRIWKKIPGLNGKAVNIDKSYEKMKEAGVFNEKLLVFDEIKPAVSLNELPPAPIYRGNPNKKMVALMVNVSWGTEFIPPILKILNDQQVKATFFIEGKWAKNNAKYVQMITEEGHLIGNHAYNHPDMARISVEEIESQIINTNDTIQAITGEVPTLFAPPSGSYTAKVVEIADNLNMKTILWSVDTIDWKNPSVSVMMNRVIPQLHSGATILMHPTEAVVRGLEDLIKAIKEKNYHLGTVEKLLSENRIN